MKSLEKMSHMVSGAESPEQNGHTDEGYMKVTGHTSDMTLAYQYRTFSLIDSFDAGLDAELRHHFKKAYHFVSQDDMPEADIMMCRVGSSSNFRTKMAYHDKLNVILVDGELQEQIPAPSLIVDIYESGLYLFKARTSFKKTAQKTYDVMMTCFDEQHLSTYIDVLDELEDMELSCRLYVPSHFDVVHDDIVKFCKNVKLTNAMMKARVWYHPNDGDDSDRFDMLEAAQVCFVMSSNKNMKFLTKNHIAKKVRDVKNAVSLMSSESGEKAMRIQKNSVNSWLSAKKALAVKDLLSRIESAC